ncbi:MAG: hypothetical protein OQK73_00165 [Gammaproteobacteria bacterium]|nr:hypothetical protein [Gammaproteobacteria bacterium]
MITWFNLIPVFVVPPILLFVPALLPDFMIANKTLGGAAYRTFFVDVLLLPVLSDQAAWVFIHWYRGIGEVARVWFHFLITLNVYFCAWPVIAFMGSVYLRLRNWAKLKELDLKRHTAKGG